MPPTNPAPPVCSAALRVEFDQGEPLTTRIDASWKTASNQQPGWIAADFNDSTWPAAREIAPSAPRPGDASAPANSPSAPSKPILSPATAMFQPDPNGKRHASASSWTNWRRRQRRASRSTTSSSGASLTSRSGLTSPVTSSRAATRSGSSRSRPGPPPGFFPMNLSTDHRTVFPTDARESSPRMGISDPLLSVGSPQCGGSRGREIPGSCAGAEPTGRFPEPVGSGRLAGGGGVSAVRRLAVDGCGLRSAVGGESRRDSGIQPIGGNPGYAGNPSRNPERVVAGLPQRSQQSREFCLARRMGRCGPPRPSACFAVSAF